MGGIIRWKFMILLRLLGVILLFSFIRESDGLSNSLQLSPLETTFLRSRLDKVKIGIQNEYSKLVYSALTTTATTTTTNDTVGTTGVITNTDVTFIFPGAGGVDQLILELREAVVSNGRTTTSITDNVDQHLSRTVQIIDWKEYRGGILTAAYEGEAVGEAIADMIISYYNKESDNNNYEGGIQQQQQLQPRALHFVGVSVGAFAANAAASTVYRLCCGEKSNVERGTSGVISVRLTLLDPFCGRGVFNPNYGRDNFGRDATTAIQILNTDDPVPTTNDPLPYCYCLDVTNSTERQHFAPGVGDSMHSWPLAYFAGHYDEIMSLDPTVVRRGVVDHVR